MKKFFEKHSNKFYLIGSLFLLIMIGIMGVLIKSHFNEPISAAPETWTLTINKTSAITVYASGKGVTHDSAASTDNLDVYKVEKNTSVSLQAVNESRIFTGWEFDKSPTVVSGSTTSSKITITPTDNTIVSTTRRDALVADFGLYMNSRFYINLDIHLMHLQRIFLAAKTKTNVQAKEVLDAYDYFFEKERNYERNILSLSNVDAESSETKAQLIINGNYFDKIQNGCFQVNSSFALMDESFIGIGTTSNPFNGVLCGNVNGAISTVFITSAAAETSGTMYRGLFQVTGENAVIRNLNIRTSLGVSVNSANAATNIYVGGIAGRMNNTVISNVDVLARLAVDATSANVYAGAIAGQLSGGLDHDRNIKLNGKDSTFILSTNAAEKNICAGLVTGDATNVYVKEANADVTNFAISAKNTGSKIYNANTNVYLGNLFGKFTATEMIPIENVKFNGTEKVSLTSLISSGNSYIGGLIGHLTANEENSDVQLGDIQFNITSGESKFSASSVNKESQTNLITAGLIACVVGDNLNAREEFLDGVVEKEIDGEKRYEYNYIFNTNLKIESLNHGIMDGSNYGKVMATGFIARGYMNLNGASNKERTEILLTSGKYHTKIYATQSTTTTFANGSHNSGSNDREHCIATAFYGNINKTGLTIQNLSVYGSNYDIAATRELGSLGKSDVYAAGLIGYVLNTTLTNISAYFNDSYIKGHSLSYEVKNGVANVNNTYVGGVVGSVNDTGYTTYHTMSNITFAGGYDHLKEIVIGTTSIIEGIQNTKGDTNYRNENYVGGIFGRIYRTHASGLYYIGSESEKDSINSLGHEDPATGFCGGIIGYVRNDINNGSEITINNAEIKDANVYIGATVTDPSDNQPDVYIGGIIGATFHDGNNGIITLNNSRVINSKIIAEGNEETMNFAGGVMGSCCWSGTVNINNAYIYNSSIESHLKVNTDVTNTYSCAAGVMGRTFGTTNIRHSAVIDTNIIADYINTANNNASIVCANGIHGERDGSPTVNVTNCYTNATISSTYKTTEQDRNGDIFGILNSNLNGTVTNAYYVSENVGTTNSGTSDGTALSFVPKSVTKAADGDDTNRLFTNLNYDDTNKYYIDVDDSDNFVVYEDSDHLRVYAKNENISSYADIWINAKENGNTKTPFDSEYKNEEDQIEAGWFKLGSLIVYNGSPNSSSTKGKADYTFKLGSGEYQLGADGKYYNIHYPYDSIDEVPYEITIPTIDNEDGTQSLTTTKLGSTTTYIEELITVNIADNMHQIRLDFKISPSNFYPALFDNDGKRIATSGLLHEEYGNFEYDINGDDYYIVYKPNEELNHDQVFYIGFVSEDNTEVYSKCYKFVLKHNAYVLLGAIYADYTKPINYQFIEYNNNTVYLLRPSTITKIIPVFKKTNNTDIIISELNISKVSYKVSSGSVKSNGEFTSPAAGSVGTITMTFVESGTAYEKVISFKVVNQIDVSFSSIGADLDGLVYATSDSDYVLDIDLLEHYGGDPISFNVACEGAIGGTFESPTLNGTFDKLALRLGGAIGSIEFQGSKDNGATWTLIEDIDVFSEGYYDYIVDFKGYNKFKLNNNSHLQLNINQFSLITLGDNSTVTSSLDKSTKDDNVVVNSSNSEIFKMANAAIVSLPTSVKEVSAKELANSSNKIPANGYVVIDVFPYDSNNNNRYTSFAITGTGTAEIVYEAYVVTRERTGNWGQQWGAWSEPTWEVVTGNQYSNTDSRRIVCVRATIYAITDYQVATISYARGQSNNNNTGYSISNLGGNVSIHICTNYIAPVSSDEEIVFAFSGDVVSVTPTIKQGTISDIVIENNLYKFKGSSDLLISSVSATIKNYSRVNYTFDSATTTNARFNISSGGNAQATIDGCTSDTNNILLYRIDNINLTKETILYSGWMNVTSWDVETEEYRLKIPKGFITSVTSDVITIEMEFPITYTISFDLQTESFNPDYPGQTFFRFKVEVGTTFAEMFGGEDNPNMAILNNAVGPESQGGAKKFGYVFGGFYLIDTGNSLSAYSTSFDELLEKHGSMQIQSSYMYYARWSFLIELIEAPGTNISTSFESGFMEDVGLTEAERAELELSNSISIPINNNRGYVFTVQKEEGFIGEAQVNAFIVTAPSEHHTDLDHDLICDICNQPYDLVASENVFEITIEKYHDNMYLYFIPPESITGYLVIVSSVTNSSIIVGKNTASVTEQILPEDGVYTFKYVVNHKKGESYIYDSAANLLSLKRNILIEFYDLIYNGETTDISVRSLSKGTTIEVYHSLYADGVLSKQTIGVWTASGGETSVKLSQFKKWNQSEAAFDNSTFSSILGTNDSTSEVYYFVVTPPNGQNTGFTETGNEIINEVIFVGYCDEDGDYISGTRNDDEFDNIPIEDYIQGIVSEESSKQVKVYSVTPSRQTSLTGSGNNYTFKDITTYHIVDLIAETGTLTLTANNRLVLQDSASNNTVVYSSIIKGRIREIELKLGFNTGLIRVYGKKTTGDWDLIETFNVNSADYQTYFVSFERLSSDYVQFKIDNISQNEIRLESFKYVTVSNAMEYEFTLENKTIVDNKISFINTIKGDTRHDGKSFMLAIEYKNVTDISKSVSITVTGGGITKTYKPLLDTRNGKVVAYYNLSEIIKSHGTDNISITLFNDSHTLERVRLLEATSALKPAVSEERVIIIP